MYSACTVPLTYCKILVAFAAVVPDELPDAVELPVLLELLAGVEEAAPPLPVPFAPEEDGAPLLPQAVRIMAAITAETAAQAAARRTFFCIFIKIHSFFDTIFQSIGVFATSFVCIYFNTEHFSSQEPRRSLLIFHKKRHFL